MSELTDFLNVNMETRYKEGKIDQLILKVGVTKSIEYATGRTFGEVLNRTLIELLIRTKSFFEDIPMKKGASVLTYDEFINNAIQNLVEEGDDPH